MVVKKWQNLVHVVIERAPAPKSVKGQFLWIARYTFDITRDAHHTRTLYPKFQNTVQKHWDLFSSKNEILNDKYKYKW